MEALPLELPLTLGLALRLALPEGEPLPLLAPLTEKEPVPLREGELDTEGLLLSLDVLLSQRVAVLDGLGPTAVPETLTETGLLPEPRAEPVGASPVPLAVPLLQAEVLLTALAVAGAEPVRVTLAQALTLPDLEELPELEGEAVGLGEPLLLTEMREVPEPLALPLGGAALAVPSAKLALALAQAEKAVPSALALEEPVLLGLPLREAGAVPVPDSEALPLVQALTLELPLAVALPLPGAKEEEGEPVEELLRKELRVKAGERLSEVDTESLRLPLTLPVLEAQPVGSSAVALPAADEDTL